MPKRYYRKKKVALKSWPNDWVPFHWSRPEKKLGYIDEKDMEPHKSPNVDEIRPMYRSSDRLKELDVDNPVRKLFSIDHARIRDQTSDKIKDETTNLGLVHLVDFENSLEAKIIRLTYKLRRILVDIERHGPYSNKNTTARAIANVLKYRRIRYLNDLREIHSDRYSRLVDKLNIEPSEKKINVPYEKPFRKVQMRKIAIEYAQELMEKKVEDYLIALEREKEEFEKEKQETMKWIKEQEEKLGEACLNVISKV